MEEKKENIKSKELETGEDATKYGEFISSYFAWTTLEKQKENTKRLQEITNSEKQENEEEIK